MAASYKQLKAAGARRELLALLPIVHSRLQAASYTSIGQDWTALFDAFDKNKDGLIDLLELQLIRECAEGRDHTGQGWRSVRRLAVQGGWAQVQPRAQRMEAPLVCAAAGRRRAALL